MFDVCDFEAMREWLISISSNSKILKARLAIFDCYRYCEDYESIYDFISGMGGTFA